MKKYKDFVNEGLFGKKDGDEFTEKLLDIIEKENIKIFRDDDDDDDTIYYDNTYNVTVDNIKYYFSTIGSYGIEFEGQSLKISKKIYKRLTNLYNNQNSKKELPDLSDLGRSAKKYNL